MSRQRRQVAYELASKRTKRYLEPHERASIIQAHIAGDSAALISLDQGYLMHVVQQVIAEYKAEQEAIFNDFKRIDEELGIERRKAVSVPTTPVEQVLYLYRENASCTEIAKQTKLTKGAIHEIINNYNNKK